MQVQLGQSLGESSMDLGKGTRVMDASFSVGESSEHTSADSMARNPHCRARVHACHRVLVRSQACNAGRHLREGTKEAGRGW